MPDNSHVVFEQGAMTPRSALVKAIETWKTPFDIKPDGVFGSLATIKSGGVTLSSEKLDIDFRIPFDDDMEANEAEITVYNLSDSTIKQLKKGAAISVEAGYTGDTGVIFTGYISKVSTSHDGPDKSTSILALDDYKEHTIESITFAAGTKASTILNALVKKTGIPVAVFKMRRDYTYTDAETVDGDLMECIKKYADVCGVSVYVSKGKIYARYIKEGDNINFNLSPDTGLIGTPAPYEKQVKAADFTETINGYDVQMIMQHRMYAGAIVSLNSRDAKGTYRVCSGEHRFATYTAVTYAKMY